jgi:hypothetical protein
MFVCAISKGDQGGRERGDDRYGGAWIVKGCIESGGRHIVDAQEDDTWMDNGESYSGPDLMTCQLETLYKTRFSICDWTCCMGT